MAEIKKDNVVLESMDVQYIHVDDIKPNPYNPNRQSEKEFELLCRSMEEDGFTTPVVVRRSDNMIVDGEHRWRAGQSIGLKEIPVVYVDMTDAQMRISTLRHNRARGSEDIDLAADVLKQLAASGALESAQDSLMLDDVEVTKLLTEIEEGEKLDEEAFKAATEPFVGENGEVKPANEVVESTEAAADAKRAMRDEIAKRKGEEWKQDIYVEREQYKLSLTYLKDEADLVRAACGTNVANGILLLCTKEFEARGLTIEQ